MTSVGLKNRRNELTMDIAKGDFFFFWLEKLHLKNTIVPTDNSRSTFTLNFQEDLMFMTNKLCEGGRKKMKSFSNSFNKKIHIPKNYT